MSPTVVWHDSKIMKLYKEWQGDRPKIYFDLGGREYRGYFEDGREMRDVLAASGWREGVDLMYVEDRYGRHHEDSWARRLPDALRFMLADAKVIDR
jgi:predicted alpha/beta superfamily hydrolase